MTGTAECASAHRNSGPHGPTGRHVPPDGESALREAAERGDVQTIQALIKAGNDPNAKNCAGNVPLHYAAWRGHTGAVNALLAAGADIDARNNYGATPLDIAIRERRHQTAHVLRCAAQRRIQDEQAQGR